MEFVLAKAFASMEALLGPAAGPGAYKADNIQVLNAFYRMSFLALESGRKAVPAHGVPIERNRHIGLQRDPAACDARPGRVSERADPLSQWEFERDRGAPMD